MVNKYREIGDYITVIDNRNADGNITNLTGISIDKCYIPSVANIIGTDLHNYKVICKGQFACSLMQVSRDQRIPIAMYEDDNPAIMSPAYVIFEVIKPSDILPEYMELWFRRAEFDREASFYAVGGVRGSLDWEDFCKMKLPVPPIEKQRKIVHDYHVITDRIALLQKMNENLNNEGIILYNMYSNEDGAEEYQLKDVLSLLKDGTHNPPERVAKGIPLLAGQNVADGFIDHSKMTYICEEDYLSIHSRYKPMVSDLILTKIGTVGKVAILREEDIPMAIHCNSALLRFSPNMIDSCVAYWLLQSKLFISNLTERITNSVQEFVSLGNIGEIPIKLPPMDKKDFFTKMCSVLLNTMSSNNREIYKLSNVRDMMLASLSHHGSEVA